MVAVVLTNPSQGLSVFILLDKEAPLEPWLLLYDSMKKVSLLVLLLLFFCSLSDLNVAIAHVNAGFTKVNSDGPLMENTGIIYHVRNIKSFM